MTSLNYIYTIILRYLVIFGVDYCVLERERETKRRKNIKNLESQLSLNDWKSKPPKANDILSMAFLSHRCE